ncbi:MAG: hypothetical protein RR984_02525 [Bacilli bacterium]
MGFWDSLFESDGYNSITISDGKSTYNVNVKLIYSFPRIKIYQTKDQGFLAVGLFRNESKENFIQSDHLDGFLSKAGKLGIAYDDLFKMLPDVLGFDYFIKNDKYLTVGGVPSIIDHFYHSNTVIPDDDEGWNHQYQPTIVNANRSYDFYKETYLYFVNDGSYFIDCGLHISADGRILSDPARTYLFTANSEYTLAIFDAFSRNGIKLQVPQYLHENYKSGKYKELKDYMHIFTYV